MKLTSDYLGRIDEVPKEEESLSIASTSLSASNEKLMAAARLAVFGNPDDRVITSSMASTNTTPVETPPEPKVDSDDNAPTSLEMNLNNDHVSTDMLEKAVGPNTQMAGPAHGIRSAKPLLKKSQMRQLEIGPPRCSKRRVTFLSPAKSRVLSHATDVNRQSFVTPQSPPLSLPSECTSQKRTIEVKIIPRRKRNQRSSELM